LVMFFTIFDVSRIKENESSRSRALYLEFFERTCRI
jgi:hypothetical protein